MVKMKSETDVSSSVQGIVDVELFQCLGGFNKKNSKKAQTNILKK